MMTREFWLDVGVQTLKVVQNPGRGRDHRLFLNNTWKTNNQSNMDNVGITVDSLQHVGLFIKKWRKVIIMTFIKNRTRFFNRLTLLLRKWMYRKYFQILSKVYYGVTILRDLRSLQIWLLEAQFSSKFNFFSTKFCFNSSILNSKFFFF